MKQGEELLTAGCQRLNWTLDHWSELMDKKRNQLIKIKTPPSHSIVYCCLFFVLMNTGYINLYITDWMKIAALIFLAFAYVLNIRATRFSKVSVCILLFMLVSIVSTAMSKRSVFSVIARFEPVIAMLLLFEVCHAKGELLSCLKIFGRMGSALIFVDFFTILLYPDGLYKSDLYAANWLLGYKSARVYLGLPVLCFSSIVSLAETGGIRFTVHLSYIVLIASSALTDSGMGLACCVVQYLFLVLSCLKTLPLPQKFFDYRVWSFGFIAIALIVYFVGTNQWLNNFLISIGKDPTFTGRTFIWQATINRFLDSPIIGFGYIDSDEYLLMTGVPGGTTAHSFILTILELGGFVGLVLILAAMVLGFRNYRPTASLSSSSIAASCFATAMLMGITSCNLYATFVLPLLVVLRYAEDGDIESPSVDVCTERQGKLNEATLFN